MTGTILWTGSAGYAGLTGVPVASVIEDAVLSAANVLTIPPLTPTFGGNLTLILWFANTDVVNHGGLFADYGFLASFRGTQVAGPTSTFGSGIGIFKQSNLTSALQLDSPCGEFLFDTTSEFALGGSVDLYAITGVHTSSITGMVYGMVVDFEFNPGYVPQLNTLQSVYLDGFHDAPIDVMHGGANGQSGSLIIFNVLYGAGVTAPTLASYSPSQTIINSDSVSYNNASITYNTFISPINIVPDIYAGLPQTGGWYPANLITYTASWTPTTRYTLPYIFIWEPVGGISAVRSRGRSYAQVIG